MTATFNVIHLSYKLRPWGYPIKLIRSEREGKQIENLSKLQQTIGFKDSSINNLTVKFFPPLPLFFFPGDRDNQIENRLGPPRSRKSCRFKYTTFLKLKTLQAALSFQTTNSLEEF